MADDQGYEDFLDKANQDTGVDKKGKGGDSKFASTKAVDTSVPKALQSVGDHFYTSDSDEPFEAVALKHNGKDLTKSNFAKLIGHDGEVESSDVKQFDPKGKYRKVIDAVSEAGDGEHAVKVFRVEHGGTRSEWYLVTIDKDGNVVGAKAKAVES